MFLRWEDRRERGADPGPGEKTLKIRIFLKKGIDKSPMACYNALKFEYHKNDYDEDGRMAKLSRELPGGARQQQILPMTYPF